MSIRNGSNRWDDSRPESEPPTSSLASSALSIGIVGVIGPFASIPLADLISTQFHLGSAELEIWAGLLIVSGLTAPMARRNQSRQQGSASFYLWAATPNQLAVDLPVSRARTTWGVANVHHPAQRGRCRSRRTDPQLVALRSTRRIANGPGAR